MTNYNKGANFERRVKRYLEDCGYYVVRSAGSHGVLDLVGFHVHRRPIGVQCKYGCEASEKELDTLFKFAQSYRNIRILVAYGKPKNGIQFFDPWTRTNASVA